MWFSFVHLGDGVCELFSEWCRLVSLLVMAVISYLDGLCHIAWLGPGVRS